MPITTRAVAIATEQVLGTALPLARVRFRLSAPDTQAGELVVPEDAWADLDASGNGSIGLWPNVLGAGGGTSYAVTVFDRYNRVCLTGVAVVPDADTTLLACLQLAPAPALPAAVPAGGTPGQVLTKSTSADYASQWRSPPFYVHSYWLGQPPAAVELLRVPLAAAVTFPADFAGSHAVVKVAPAADAVFPIQVAGVGVGTATFPAGQTVGVLSSGGLPVPCADGAVFAIVSPAVQDALLESPGFALAAAR